ncbi:hypothetical protein QJQ45_029845, partial [Haematococcus lacustris]
MTGSSDGGDSSEGDASSEGGSSTASQGSGSTLSHNMSDLAGRCCRGVGPLAGGRGGEGPMRGGQQQQEPAKYLPPALRGEKAEGGAALERRLTGLMNRLAESKLAGIVKEVAALYASEGRRAVGHTVTRLLLDAATEGPRASAAFASVAAAFIAGCAGSCRAPELAAAFMEGLALRLERAVRDTDSLAQRNLAALLAHCYLVGLMGHDLIFSLLDTFKERFGEDDVQLMVVLLSQCGLRLRAADPAAFKTWVLAVHARAAQARTATPTPLPTPAPGAAAPSATGRAGLTSPPASAPAPGPAPSPGPMGLSKRAELMLDLVIDIKNNRQSKVVGGKVGASGAGHSPSPALLKWLSSCNAGEVALRGITWTKLCAPGKKGMWWLPAAGEALIGSLHSGPTGRGPQGAASLAALVQAQVSVDRPLPPSPPPPLHTLHTPLPPPTDPLLSGGGSGLGAEEAERLLALAAAQRMNTDVRRAVFLAVMGSEDCGEAFEKLVRLPIKGDQEREVVRVVVDCALQEAAYNPYYAILLAKLAAHSKAHRLTLQFRLWDGFKALPEAEPRALGHLARLTAFMLASATLPLTCVK